MALSFVLEVPGAGHATVSSSSLSAGDYWASGNVSLAPNTGNYTSSTLLSDGSAGDTTTRETSSSDTFTLLRVNSSLLSIEQWALTMRYRGVVTPVGFTYWDGSAWQSMSDTNAAPWTVNATYTDASRTATFLSVPNATIWRFVWTESNTSSGNASVSDSRVS